MTTTITTTKKTKTTTHTGSSTAAVESDSLRVSKTISQNVIAVRKMADSNFLITIASGNEMIQIRITKKYL